MDDSTAPPSDWATCPVQQSASIDELAKALSAAQGELGALTKDATNDFYDSSYATLAACCAAALPVLSKHGLSVVQLPGGDGTTVTVTAQLMHASGQWIRCTLGLTPTKADPQGVGSAITYGRRYTLLALVGLAPEDDDGNSASRSAEPAPDPKTHEATQALETLYRSCTNLGDLRSCWETSLDAYSRLPMGCRVYLEETKDTLKIALPQT